MRATLAWGLTVVGLVLMAGAGVALYNRSSLDSRELLLVTAMTAGALLLGLGVRRAFPPRP
jgi:hypothetical protein